MFRRTLVAVAPVLLLAGCQDRPLPTEAPESLGSPVLAMSDASTGGNPAFHFLAPFGQSRSFAGAFDPAAPVEVTVCRTTGWPCAAGDRAALLTAADNGSERLTVDVRKEVYETAWHPQPSQVRVGHTYRVSVAVGTVRLGFADVRVVQHPRDEAAVPAGTVGLKIGQKLDIRFRVERGAVAATQVTPGAAATLVTADGAAKLAIPAGAVGEAVTLAVQPVAAPADPDDRLVGGTAYEFGPAGTSFEEPVTLTLKYDESQVVEGTEALLRLHLLRDGRWVPIAGSRVDAEANAVIGEVEHFSVYAVLPVGFAQMTTGENHACALTATGEAWCWGLNDRGQLGAPTAVACPNGACSPVAVAAQGNLTFTELAAGWSHTCGLTAAGEIYCWGGNDTGELGDGTTVARTLPVRAAPGLTFRAVSAEYRSTCGITTAGDVACWGQNNQRQLGSVSAACGALAVACSTVPLTVPGVSNVTQVDIGLSQACALTTSGSVYCWGWNLFRQSGAPSGNVVPPTLIAGGPYREISAGAVHSCAVTTAGATACWGTSFNTGALGDGASNTTSAAPVAVAGGLTASRLSAGNGNYIYTHSCLVTPTGKLYCWGSNLDGALAPDTPIAPSCPLGHATAPAPSPCATTPQPAAGALRFGDVNTGAGYTCGYTTTGDIYCWGLNGAGQLGDGTTTGRSSPARVLTN